MLNSRTLDALKTWGTAAGGLAGVLEGTADNWDEARGHYLDEMASAFPAPDGVSFSQVDMGGVPGTLITPELFEPGRILLYIHGGGYASGGPRAYHGLGGRYAKLLKAKVYIPDYRLAPQFQFPIPIDDVFTSYRFLLDHGVDPKELTISGDSAGGAMVVTIMRKARDAGIALPAAGVAISPWANLAHTGESCRTREGLDPLCGIYFLNLLARTFLGDALPTDPDCAWR